MFDRIKDLISDPGSIQDKLGNLQEEFLGGGAENLQEQVGNFGGLGAIQEQLNGVEFPIGRDDLANVLEGRGVPTQITDQLHNLDIAQFQNPSEVMGLITGFLRR